MQKSCLAIDGSRSKVALCSLYHGLESYQDTFFSLRVPFYNFDFHQCPEHGCAENDTLHQMQFAFMYVCRHKLETYAPQQYPATQGEACVRWMYLYVDVIVRSICVVLTFVQVCCIYNLSFSLLLPFHRFILCTPRIPHAHSAGVIHCAFASWPLKLCFKTKKKKTGWEILCTASQLPTPGSGWKIKKNIMRSLADGVMRDLFRDLRSD